MPGPYREFSPAADPAVALLEGIHSAGRSTALEMVQKNLVAGADPAPRLRGNDGGRMSGNIKLRHYGPFLHRPVSPLPTLSRLRLQLRTTPRTELRHLPFVSFSFVTQTVRADQDDVGYRLILNPLHIPAFAQGVALWRQFDVAIPAAPLARGADSVQRGANVNRQPLQNGHAIQLNLPFPQSLFNNSSKFRVQFT